MNTSSLKYALLVFLGGASYGAMAPIAKLAGSDGFSWQQIACSQAVFGMAIFAIAFAFKTASGTRPAKVSPVTIAKLMGTGMMTCSTCLLYNVALSRLPVAVAITLLFQFTWVGIVIQMIATKRPPRTTEALAALVVVVGTALASGLFSQELAINYDPIGIVCGLASSVTCALFMFLSGKVEPELPRMQRGFIVCCGAALLGLCACPSYFAEGVILQGMAPYGVILGLTALFIPVLFFGIGTPHLPTGVSTVLASAELPSGILLTYLATGVGIDLLQLCGVVVILAGVALSQLPSSKRPHA